MPFITKKKLQAMTYAQGMKQSILNLNLDELLKTSNWVNQFQTYETQVEAIYKKYKGYSAYGASYVSDIIDKRTNLIISEGLSITAKNSTAKFIDEFLDYNKLDGSKLIELVRISEMEGRTLTLLIPINDKDKKKVKIKNIKHATVKYKLNINEVDDEILDSIEINDSTGKPILYSPDKFQYSHCGLSLKDDPTSCIATVLTQIENADRALYDLRKSNHLFGFPTPNIEATDSIEAQKIKNDLTKENWKIGTTLIGAKMSFPQPPNSVELLKGEISLNLKIISSKTGIPVHWLGWTDLMSNRATAFDLRDFINMSVRDEKIRFREFMKELIIKAMTISVDYGVEGAVLDEDFEVDLPDVSMETVKQLSETWLPLYESDIISRFDVQNKIPGINPLKTNKQIDKEKKENMEIFSDGLTQPQPDETGNQDTQNNQDPQGNENIQLKQKGQVNGKA